MNESTNQLVVHCGVVLVRTLINKDNKYATLKEMTNEALQCRNLSNKQQNLVRDRWWVLVIKINETQTIHNLKLLGRKI